MKAYNWKPVLAIGIIAAVSASLLLVFFLPGSPMAKQLQNTVLGPEDSQVLEANPSDPNAFIFLWHPEFSDNTYITDIRIPSGSAAGFKLCTLSDIELAQRLEVDSLYTNRGTPRIIWSNTGVWGIGIVFKTEGKWYSHPFGIPEDVLEDFITAIQARISP